MRKFAELSFSHSCMSKARPTEMTFVLLGRDVVAPDVIREWCRLRCLHGKNTPQDKQIQEALACAEAMEKERTGEELEPLAIWGVDAEEETR